MRFVYASLVLASIVGTCPAADAQKHPYAGAAPGSWAEYRIAMVGNGKPPERPADKLHDGGTLKITVLSKDEKKVRVRVEITSKPDDESEPETNFMERTLALDTPLHHESLWWLDDDDGVTVDLDERFRKSDERREKVTAGGKSYQASVTELQFKKPSLLKGPFATMWESADAPAPGLVKMNYQQKWRDETVETTMELINSGRD